MSHFIPKGPQGPKQVFGVFEPVAITSIDFFFVWDFLEKIDICKSYQKKTILNKLR